VAAALLAGCGEGKNSETATQPASKPAAKPRKDTHIWVSLNGHAGAENVGLLMAEARGYFEDVGLSVGTGTPNEPRNPVLYVAGRTTDFSVSQLPQVALAAAKGRRVIAVGSLLPRPTAALIWLEKSGIRDIADLKGKTIAVPGVPFQEGFLQIFLAQAGLTFGDVKVKVVEYDLVPALVSGSVDAIFGTSNIEGAQLESRGLRPIVTPVRRLGVPAYDEVVVVARTRRASRNPQLVRDFMSAVARGTAAAVEDPEAAVRVIEESNERDLSLGRKEIEAEVKATLPLLSRTGHMSPRRARRFVDWMREERLIRQKLAIPRLLTNGYLAPRR
jgi:putative hydroxymethylpyrimidine transport system substrate-binding protein